MTSDRITPDTGIPRRVALAETYGTETRAAWREAKANGMKDPVVFIFDCRDQIGGTIARSVLGKNAVDAEIAKIDARGTGDAILMTCRAFNDCHTLTQIGFHHLDDTLADPPEGDEMVWAVFAAGGVTGGRWKMTGRHVPKQGMN